MLSLVFVNIFPQIETNTVQNAGHNVSSSSLGENCPNAGKNGGLAPCSTQRGL